MQPNARPKSYQDYTRAKGLYPIGSIHRTSHLAKPGDYIMVGSGSRGSIRVEGEQ